MKLIRISFLTFILTVTCQAEHSNTQSGLQSNILASLLNKGNHFSFISQSLNQIKHKFINHLENAGYNDTLKIQTILAQKHDMSTELKSILDIKEDKGKVIFYLLKRFLYSIFLFLMVT